MDPRGPASLCGTRRCRAPAAATAASDLLGERLPQHFREMPHAHRLASRVETAAQMREAAGVVRDDAVHAGGVHVRELPLEHAVRDLRVLEAEAAAEPA